MPQLSKGGKFVFGWSVINADRKVKLPHQTVDEYKLRDPDKLIVFSGSKATGGFCVSTPDFIMNSPLRGLFGQYPDLYNCKIQAGDFVKYKGRLYGWISLNDHIIKLTPSMLTILDLKVGDRLLSIRGSNLAFVMGVKGPLIEMANQTDQVIEIF